MQPSLAFLDTATPKDPEDAEARVADTQGNEEVTATVAEADESQNNEQERIPEQEAVKEEALKEGEEQVKEPEVLFQYHVQADLP